MLTEKPKSQEFGTYLKNLGLAEKEQYQQTKSTKYEEKLALEKAKNIISFDTKRKGR